MVIAKIASGSCCLRRGALRNCLTDSQERPRLRPFICSADRLAPLCVALNATLLVALPMAPGGAACVWQDAAGVVGVCPAVHSHCRRLCFMLTRRHDHIVGVDHVGVCVAKPCRHPRESKIEILARHGPSLGADRVGKWHTPGGTYPRNRCGVVGSSGGDGSGREQPGMRRDASRSSPYGGGGAWVVVGATCRAVNRAMGQSPEPVNRVPGGVAMTSTLCWMHSMLLSGENSSCGARNGITVQMTCTTPEKNTPALLYLCC